MLGDPRVERICSERVPTADQIEAIRGYDQVQIADHTAYGTVTVGHFEFCGREHFESNAAAVTTAGVSDHQRDASSIKVQRRLLMLVLLSGQIVDQGDQALRGPRCAHIRYELAIDHKRRNAVDAIALHELIGSLHGGLDGK